MKTEPWLKPGRPAAVWSEVLLRLGFTSSAGAYRREQVRLQAGAGWLVLTEPVAERPDADARLFSLPNRPGLWKRVRHRATGVESQLFAFPAVLLPEDDLGDTECSEGSVTEQMLAWALTTARGELPAGWVAPEPATVASWFAKDRLTVVAGELLRQGEVICEPQRLGLRFSITPQLPELPPARAAWLEDLFAEAQSRWHLVRFVWEQDATGRNAVAEIDFSGAPPAILENLFATGLDALRWTVQWLGEPADWLADATMTPELLAICPNDEP